MHPIHILTMTECIHAALERLELFDGRDAARAAKETIKLELEHYWEKAVAIVWDVQDVHRAANGIGRCMTFNEAVLVLRKAFDCSNRDDFGPYINMEMFENILNSTSYGREMVESEQRAIDHHERDIIIASEQDRFRVFNETDGVYVMPNAFESLEDAKAFIKAFRARYESQGYYNTAAGEQINPDFIGFEIQLATPDKEGGENNNAEVRCGDGGTNPEPAHQDSGQR